MLVARGPPTSLSPSPFPPHLGSLPPAPVIAVANAPGIHVNGPVSPVGVVLTPAALDGAPDVTPETEEPVEPSRASTPEHQWGWTETQINVCDLMATKDWGTRWKDLTEEVCDDPWGKLLQVAPGERPSEIAAWMKDHRKPRDYTKLEANFGDRLTHWWYQIGPVYRRGPPPEDHPDGERWPPRVHQTPCSTFWLDWNMLRQGGNNGMLLVVQCLMWWGQSIVNEGAGEGLGGGEVVLAAHEAWNDLLEDILEGGDGEGTGGGKQVPAKKGASKPAPKKMAPKKPAALRKPLAGKKVPGKRKRASEEEEEEEQAEGNPDAPAAKRVTRSTTRPQPKPMYRGAKSATKAGASRAGETPPLIPSTSTPADVIMMPVVGTTSIDAAALNKDTDAAGSPPIEETAAPGDPFSANEGDPFADDPLAAMSAEEREDYKRSALLILRTEPALVKWMVQEGVKSTDKFHAWLEEERTYLLGLKEAAKTNEETMEMEYVQKLVNLSARQAKYNVVAAEARRATGGDAPYVPGVHKAVMARRHAKAKVERDTESVEKLEEALLIAERWTTMSPKWVETTLAIKKRKYQLANALELLIVERIFELTKMNQSQTGYKMCKHIAKALQARLKAVRAAIDHYNAAVIVLEPSVAAMRGEFSMSVNVAQADAEEFRRALTRISAGKISADSYVWPAPDSIDYAQVSAKTCKDLLDLLRGTKKVKRVRKELGVRPPETPVKEQIARHIDYHLTEKEYLAAKRRLEAPGLDETLRISLMPIFDFLQAARQVTTEMVYPHTKLQLQGALSNVREALDEMEDMMNKNKDAGSETESDEDADTTLVDQ
ncbi:hypothetical protein C8R43DRAFT_1132965 [Mycena crocata]|nr:hypothetical protein C8R43DRAFT_1132965 [Mycena crocata]